MPPNVLLIVLDAARVDHFSCYGYERATTPNIDSFAADAVQFENAFAAGPWTPPSHASMFTGKYPTNHGYYSDERSVSGPTLAELLADSGYKTLSTSRSAMIGAHTPMGRGFDTCLNWYTIPHTKPDWSEIYDYYLSIIPAWIRYLASQFSGDEELGYLSTQKLNRWIRRQQSVANPFFGFVNILSPHSAYDAPEPYRSRFTRPRDDSVDEEKIHSLADRGGHRYIAGQIDVSEDEWRAVKDLYDGELAYADNRVGKILDTLKQTGQYNDTLVIVTADHGEHFGENGRAYHQFSLYEEVIHVPLVIKFPGQEYSGRVEDSIVSLIDLFPTVLETANTPLPDDIDGSSLYPPSQAGHRLVFSEYGLGIDALNGLEKYCDGQLPENVLTEIGHSLQCVRSKRDKYIKHFAEKKDEYYDFQQRVTEDVNLISEPDERQRERIKYLRSELNSRFSEPPAVDSTVSDSPEVREQLRQLGYL